MRALLFAALAVGASVELGALEQPGIARSAPAREGGAWVERREFTVPAHEGGRLVLRAESAAVVLGAGTSDRVEGQVVLRAYTGSEEEARRYFAGYELTAAPVDGGVAVNGRTAAAHHRSNSLCSEIKLKVPRRFNLDLETQGGDITLSSAFEGTARATTAGGDINTQDVSGPLRAETAGGSIKIGNVGQRVDARTAGGSIRVGNVKGDAVLETSGGEIVTGQIDGSLRAETAGGDVVIGGAAGRIVAQTAGGQIEIGKSGGNVRVETAGGSIRLRGTRGQVVAETAGGNIDLYEIQGAIKASTAAGRILAQFDSKEKAFGASQLQTSRGDVEVFLPADLPLTIDAAIDMAAGHQIRSDFPVDIQWDKEEFVQRTVRGRMALNGGGELLRIRTVAGSIDIRKLDSQALEQLRQRRDSAWKPGRENRNEK
jgi:DUF4097 and DUF4098 domain-containing protein YvlB